MDPRIGWLLAIALAVLAWLQFGWQGLVVAATVTVFWLLLQFNRTLRVVKNASNRPVGLVPNAVMLHSKLARGLPLWRVLRLTKSLGRRVEGLDDAWCWADQGGASVTVELKRGRVQAWRLMRDDEHPHPGPLPTTGEGVVDLPPHPHAPEEVVGLPPLPPGGRGLG